MSKQIINQAMLKTAAVALLLVLTACAPSLSRDQGGYGSGSYAPSRISLLGPSDPIGP